MMEAAYKLFFGTLANSNRIAILEALNKESLNVTQLARKTRLEQTAVSHNLKRLEKCGFVFVEQDGRFRYYTLNKKTIKPLMNLINEHMDRFCRKIVAKEKKFAIFKDFKKRR